MASVIYDVWRTGGRLEGWDEFFDYERWLEAFNKNRLDIKFYTERKRSFDEVLPWSHINVGVSTDFLKSEALRAYDAKTTPNCREKCSNCGIVDLIGGACPVYGES